ncbi:VanW family protein [Desnuesiella massiliensis]|uniref:VanW family protein n=1 Tax=Desnuesiella massiliensis TaxID=1650662 RepID=UPI0006E32E6E|nr:VanW family protein [Desnuesiella massiliensis]
MLLSERSKMVYIFRVEQKRAFKKITTAFDGNKYATTKLENQLPVRVKKHQSVLIRKLGNSNIELQYNKVVNLKLAAEKINGVIITPGETFSFWRLVGKTSKKKGYKEGMCLSMGEVKTGVGGGLCQLSNLIYWMVLHSPLTVTERYRHSFDPFPDNGRVLPFASGATVFYNYVDLKFINSTPYTFQINISFDNKYIKGEIRADKELEESYHVFERNHRFIEGDGKYYRENEIWRTVLDKNTGNKIREEMLIKNHCEVKYKLDMDNDKI